MDQGRLPIFLQECTFLPCTGFLGLGRGTHGVLRLHIRILWDLEHVLKHSNLLVRRLLYSALQVSGRRLRNYGGSVHEKLGVLLQTPIPRWRHILHLPPSPYATLMFWHGRHWYFSFGAAVCTDQADFLTQFF